MMTLMERKFDGKARPGRHESNIEFPVAIRHAARTDADVISYNSCSQKSKHRIRRDVRAHEGHGAIVGAVGMSKAHFER